MRSIRLRKVLASIVISCVAFGVVGCAEKNASVDSNSNIVSGNLDNQQSGDNKKEDNIEKIENADNLDNQESINTIEMLLYSNDLNTDEQVIVGTVEVDEELSLEEKIEKLSKELSEKVFDSLPIEFVKIDA